MFKRAFVSFTELTLWLVVMSMFVGGFSHPATGKERLRAAGKQALPDRQTSKSNVTLIPRDVLFGNPRRAQARLSHDGNGSVSRHR